MRESGIIKELLKHHLKFFSKDHNFLKNAKLKSFDPGLLLPSEPFTNHLSPMRRA